MKNARQLVLEVLLDVDRGIWSNRSLDIALNASELDARDRRFATQLTYGVIDNQLLLDYQIRKYSKTRLKKLHAEIRNILRMGFYQILFMDTVTDAAAVDESVKLAKKTKRQFSGFVNGILRQFLRDGAQLHLPDKNKNTAQYLSIRYSHPQWMVDRWMSRYGQTFTEQLLAADNAPPSLVMRTNTQYITRTRLLQRLHDEGLDAVFGELTEESIVLSGLHDSIADVDAFREGLMTVQDEASMLVGHIAAPEPGMTVLDVCSAPGGKASHIAQLMGGEGRVIARDIYPQKLEKIKNLATRLGLKNIEVQQHDATELDDKLVEAVDLVLVDAPCSGLGIIRRKPDIRFNRSEEDIAELSQLQAKILNVSAEYVKPGGVLVYSTCTTEPEENVEQIRAFLEANPSFTPDPSPTALPERIETGEFGSVSLFPHLHGTDGFFICRLRKKID